MNVNRISEYEEDDESAEEDYDSEPYKSGHFAGKRWAKMQVMPDDTDVFCLMVEDALGILLGVQEEYFGRKAKLARGFQEGACEYRCRFLLDSEE